MQPGQLAAPPHIVVKEALLLISDCNSQTRNTSSLGVTITAYMSTFKVWGLKLPEDAPGQLSWRLSAR